jgi:MinD-like ATPase involved in chromosome partitioning or flagellar assembly
MGGPLRIAVGTTSAGQGSTTYALALAWSAADSRQVRLIDADPAVGTISDLVDLPRDLPSSVENLVGSFEVQPSAIVAQSVSVPGRPSLSVVPGFRRWEFSAAAVLGRIGPALSGLPDEVVIVDVGCPFEPPRDPGARRATAMLAESFDAVLLVIRAQADLLSRAFAILASNPVARARLVVTRPPQRREMARTMALIQQELPMLGTPLEWEWDHARVLSAAVNGPPLSRQGLLEETGLVGSGSLVDVTGAHRRRLVPFLSRGGWR